MNYFLLMLLLLGGFGVSVEINPYSQAWQLLSGFHLAGLVAITGVSLTYLKKLPTRRKRYLFVLLQCIAFRIAYFPVVVFSATVSCYFELCLSFLKIDLPINIFPIMFISAAILFSVIHWILFFAINCKASLYALLILLGSPALLISFADKDDLTFLPDNNWADIAPLPQITLPQANPYGITSTHSAGQNMIGIAGKVLYDCIPNAPWSQAVQGTLEQAYRNHPNGNAHDQLRYHYAAFLAAHRQLSSRESS